MEERIWQALGQIQAKETLKENTLNTVSQRLSNRKIDKSRWQTRLAMVTACLLVMLIGGGWVYVTPTATIDIESESALILKTNRWGRVIEVEGTNEAGQELAETLSLYHCHYQAAIQQILEEPMVAEGLAQGSELVVVIEGKNESQCQKMMEHMEDCVDRYENARCYHGGSMEAVGESDWGKGNGNRGHGHHGGGGQK